MILALLFPHTYVHVASLCLCERDLPVASTAYERKLCLKFSKSSLHIPLEVDDIKDVDLLTPVDYPRVGSSALPFLIVRSLLQLTGSTSYEVL